MPERAVTNALTSLITAELFFARRTGAGSGNLTSVQLATIDSRLIGERPLLGRLRTVGFGIWNFARQTFYKADF